MYLSCLNARPYAEPEQWWHSHHLFDRHAYMILALDQEFIECENLFCRKVSDSPCCSAARSNTSAYMHILTDHVTRLISYPETRYLCCSSARKSSQKKAPRIESLSIHA